jgi:hypothetical protein
VPVYDLTVEHHHCYQAQGLLVSNSDAFRQFGQVVDAGEKFGIGSSDVNRPLIKPVRPLVLGRQRLRGSGSMTA